MRYEVQFQLTEEICLNYSSMTKMTEVFRIKNKSLAEVSALLFSLKELPKSFTETFEIKNIKIPSELEKGAKVSLTLKRFGVSAECEYQVMDLSEDKLVYRQSCGLMKKWEHEMLLTETDKGVELTDSIIYDVPYGVFGHLANDLFFKSEVSSMLYKRLKYLKLK